MLKRLKSLVDDNEAIIKSGRDAMNESELTQIGGLETELKLKSEQIDKLQSDYNALRASYDSLYATARGMEFERNGLIVAIKVFTETSLTHAKTA